MPNLGQAESVLITASNAGGATVDAIEPKTKGLFSSLLFWLFDGYWPTQNHDEDFDRVVGPRHVYHLQDLLAVGDVSDIHAAHSEAEPETNYLVKVSRVVEGPELLNN